MGLLDGLLGQVLGNIGGGGGQGNLLANALMGLLNGQGGGGLGGLIGQLQQNGLGQQVASWISTGQNMPVSAEQILQALGQGQVSQIAAQAGLNTQQASTGLAQLLPQLIDHLTPAGTLPQGNDLEQALGGLSKLLT